MSRMRASTDYAGHFAFVLPATTLNKLKGKKILYSVSRSDGKLMYQHSQPIEPVAGDRKMTLTTINRAMAYPWLRQTKSAPSSRAEKPKKPKETPARYLGNSSTKETHHLRNIKKNCQIDEIAEAHRVQFKTQKEAQTKGYDFCAYCFGRAKSKR